MKKLVFDTSALLAYIENESGASIVENMLLKATECKVEIFISVVSLIELFYITVQEQSEKIALQRIELTKVLPIHVVGLEETDTETVAMLKAKYRISFADSCIAGLAKIKNAELVHKDPEYETLPIKQKKLPYNKAIPKS